MVFVTLIGGLLIGLLCQPRVIVMMEKLVEWLAGETEVLGENVPQCRFIHHKPHMLCPDSNPGRRGGKPVTNRLSYGTVVFEKLMELYLTSSMLCVIFGKITFL
jgi:hypothetical protein